MTRLLLNLIALSMLQPTESFTISSASHKHQRQPLHLHAEYRSISDYMGGHHAGKYDFDTRISGVTSLNYEKSIIFDKDSGRRNRRKVAALEIDQLPPKWSTRSVSYENAENLLESKQMTVTNQERSWEPFYATVVGDDKLQVHPMNGTLAPRGCVDLFADSCTFEVHYSPGIVGTGNAYLVVRTEMDHWAWKLPQQSPP